MNRLCITMFFALFAIVCLGQNIRQNSDNIRKDFPQKSPNIRRDIPINKHIKASVRPVGIQKQSKQDTVYSTGTIKQHGWFAPKNIISKDAASHRIMSFRFTNRNKNGKWLKIEAINAYGDFFSGAMKPYILKNSDDSLANQEWAERIKTSCIYEFIADPTGKNIIQERAYDKDYNIVYAYSSTSIGERNGKKMFIGSYKDCYGLPAEMRPEKGFSYGTLVLITEDKRGNDSIVEYIDSKGIKKLNAELADKEYFIYDEDANLIMQQSRDSVGNLIIDKCGNCGIQFTYDERGNVKTTTFMDDKWRPMHLPNNPSAEEHAGVQCIIFKYDEYDREIERKFVDINGNNEENAYGCHKIVCEYDDRGNMVKQNCYNIKGQLSPNTLAGVAVVNNTYDDKGRIKESVFLDKDKKPNGTQGYLSKIKKEYDEDGNEVLVESYSAETGEEELCYQMISKPNYKYTLWNDGTSRIDSLDSKGRTTFVGFYGADGKYIMFEGRAYERFTYFDQNGTTKQTHTNFDQNGNTVEVSDFAKEETLVDSVSWTKTIWRYDKNNILTDVYIQKYTPGFNQVLSQDDANQFGIVSRSGGANSARYYKGNVMYNIKGEKITHLYGVDEFGEPDYIMTSNGVYYYSKSNNWYDINNKIITSNDSIMNSLPKVMTIEVTDSSAYALGLRDNDIIITYGDYAVNLDSVVSYLTFKQEWTIRSVIDATKEKRMVVFRITDASKNEYGLYEIKGLKGTCSELGFLPHIRLLTEKQINRIKESIHLEIGKDYPTISDSDLRKENFVKGENMVLISYTELYREIRNEPYGKEIKDPAILLGTCIADRQQKWTVDNKSDISPFEKILFSRFKRNNNYPIWNLFFTTDSKNIISLSLEKQNITPINYNGKSYITWSDVYISDEDYRQLSSLYVSALDSINVIMKQRNGKNFKNFVGNWVSQPNDSLQYAPKAFMSLSKDGKYVGQIVNYGKIHFDYGDHVFKKVNRCSGTWLSSGSWLFINPDEEEISLTCIDLLGEQEENEKQILNNYMNNICKTNKEYVLRQIQYYDNKIDNDFYDVSINKDVFEAKLASGKTIVFKKTKEKIDILAEASGAETGMSGEEKNAIDENCPYIGSWQCKLPGVDKSNVEFELSQSGNLEIDLFTVVNQAMNDSCSVDIILDINVKGSWKPTDNGMRFNIDPEKFNIDTDFVLHGIDDSTKVNTIRAMKEYFDSQKHEMGISLLRGFMNEMVVTEVDTMRIVMNGNELTRTPSQRVSVIGMVEAGTDYYLSNKGYKGLFIVLEWCGWNCRYGLDEFSEEFNKQKDNKKHIMLLPVETNDGKDVFKDIIELDVPEVLLGIRLMDQNVGRLYYKYNIMKRYKEYKKSKERE